MIKKTLIVLAAAAALAGCGGKDDGIRKFTVGFDADFPPYGYKEGAEYKGFDLDLAREVCARKGWKFVANPINWGTKDMELNSGAIDCIWNGFTMQGREEGYTFSEPYLDNSQVVLVRADSPIATFADLAGKIVGVQTDTPVAKALSEGGDRADLGGTFGALVIEPNYNQLVNELDMGAVEAVALDVGVAKRKMSDLPDHFKILDEIVMRETYGVGFKKGNTALRDEVMVVLREIAADGTMATLAQVYGIEPSALLLK